jgi:hypothetical protein
MYKHTLKRFVGIHNMSRLTCTWPHRNRKERKIEEVREALDTFAPPKKTKTSMIRVCIIRCGCADITNDISRL